MTPLGEQTTIRGKINKADTKRTKINETIERFNGLKWIGETDMTREMTTMHQRVLHWKSQLNLVNYWSWFMFSLLSEMSFWIIQIIQQVSHGCWHFIRPDIWTVQVSVKQREVDLKEITNECCQHFYPKNTLHRLRPDSRLTLMHSTHSSEVLVWQVGDYASVCCTSLHSTIGILSTSDCSEKSTKKSNKSSTVRQSSD